MVFCRPKGIGVNLANNTTRNARGPDITRSMDFAVSFFINLHKKNSLIINLISYLKKIDEFIRINFLIDKKLQ